MSLYFIYYHYGVLKIEITINSLLRHPPRGNLKTHVKIPVVYVTVFTEKDDHLEGKKGTVILHVANLGKSQLTFVPS